jgi:flagella basal body P-ring formation protein FlgA
MTPSAALAFAVAAATAVALVPAPAAAAPIDAVLRAELEALLPAGAGVGTIHLPKPLVGLDVTASDLVIAVRGALRPGRPSIQVTVHGKRAVWVPVTIGKLATVPVATRELAVGEVITAADVELVDRAAEPGVAAAEAVIGSTVTRSITAGAPVPTASVAAPPPVPRGTEVEVISIRGAVRIRGRGVLERAARPGQRAEVRLLATKAIARGTLTATSTVMIGDAP